MSDEKLSLFLPAIDPATVPVRTGTVYPDAFKAVVAGRSKQALGDAAGIKNFGVNLVRLAPGAASSIRHWHQRQDEFVYVLRGEVTLVTEGGEQRLRAGMAAGFPAGKADGHHLVNRSGEEVMYLEMGDRLPGDEAIYPDADLAARQVSASWLITHKDGRSYES
jgi:uncharacterized cupin superfamily protein